MVCNKCYTSNPDNSKFCEKCGSPLTPEKTAEQNVPPIPQAPEPAPKKKSSAGKTIGIILGILAGLAALAVAIVIIVVVVIFLIFGKTKENKVIVNTPVEYSDISEDTESETETDIEPESESVPEPSSPAVTSPYQIMNVTSNLGLNVRAAPGTDSTILAVLIQDRHVFVERVENNWAYIKSGDLRGWCSLDYLVPVALQNTRTYTEADIAEGKAAANKIIDSYCGKMPTGGRTDINASNAAAYFESCHTLYSYEASFGEQFQRLIPFAADSECVYYFVEDSTCKSVEDLCNKYFACLSDRLASSCLKDKVMIIDGKLAVAFESDYYSGYHISHTYDVALVSDTKIDVTVIAKEYAKETLMRDASGKATANSPVYESRYTFSCILEDGIWVFDSMDMLYD